MDIYDTIRNTLQGLLDSGLETEWRQRAYSSDEVNRAVARLQQLDKADYAGKLHVGGFTTAPYTPEEDDSGVSQSCATCMYYETHRRYCNLPELDLPVKAEWSCILWRI
jgi:hypothetical protein